MVFVWDPDEKALSYCKAGVLGAGRTGQYILSCGDDFKIYDKRRYLCIGKFGKLY